MRTLPIAALLLALGSAGANAQEIPEYDSDAHCSRISRDVSDQSAAGRCLWVEDYAREELEVFWPRANETVRQVCTETAAEEESYAALAVCVLGKLRDSRREQQ
jgi:hypothetical protein